MNDKPPFDTTLIYEPVTIQPVNGTAIIGRIARKGGSLEEHEAFISHLGVAMVIVERLPRSLKIEIWWNEPGEEPTSFFLPLYIHSTLTRQGQLEIALSKYLLPTLQED